MGYSSILVFMSCQYQTLIFFFQDCGEVTSCGVTSLLECHALEDIILRHNVSLLIFVSFSSDACSFYRD